MALRRWPKAPKFSFTSNVPGTRFRYFRGLVAGHFDVSAAKAFDGFEQALAVDDGDDQHLLILHTVDQAVAIDKTFTVGGFKLRDLASTQRELSQAF